MITAQDVAKELDRIQSALDTDVLALAEKIRQEVIAPFCKRYRYEFVSGMGGYYFRNRDKRWVYPPHHICMARTQIDAVKWPDELNDIWEILQIETPGRGHEIGTCVNDYPTKKKVNP